jgi:hypothetical protein
MGFFMLSLPNLNIVKPVVKPVYFRVNAANLIRQMMQ